MSFGHSTYCKENTAIAMRLWSRSRIGMTIERSHGGPRLIGAKEVLCKNILFF